MSEAESYSIKEMIAEFRKDMGERLDQFDVAHKDINIDIVSLKTWRGYITGALAVITVIVIPLLVYVWNQNADTQKRLQTLSSNNYSEIRQ